MEQNAQNQIRTQVILAIKQVVKNAKNPTGLMTGKELARLLDVAESRISWIINDNQKEIDKIAANTWEQWAKHPTLGITDDGVLEFKNNIRIRKACLDAKNNGEMTGVSAYTGAGKTTNFRHFAQKTGGTSNFYVFCDGMMTSSDLLLDIAEAMKVDNPGNGRKVLKAIVKRLLTCCNTGDKPLIILDDAVKLKQSAIRIVQTLYDTVRDAGGTVGIVIAGVDGFKEEVEHRAKTNRKGFKELFRRVLHWEYLVRPTEIEARMLCNSKGLVDEYWIGVVLDASINSKEEMNNNFGTISNAIHKSLYLIANPPPPKP